MRRPHWRARYEAHLRSPYWRELKEKVIARRGNRCEACGDEGSPVDLHHETYETFPRERQKDVRLLCRKCHSVADVERARRGKYRRLWCILCGDIPGELREVDYEFMEQFQREHQAKRLAKEVAIGHPPRQAGRP
jgi:hypothetical protein